MSTDKPEVDVIRRVWVAGENAYLEVRPFADASQMAVEIVTETPENIQWFGEVHMVLDKEYARALGEALIAASKE